jgi:phosphoserine phosphatase
MANVALDLVVQAPAIGTADVAAIAELVGAHGIHRIDGAAEQSFRLTHAVPHADVVALCAAVRADCAFVPAHLERARVRVVAIDMDSTLITIESVDEIADMVGAKAEVSAITAAAMRGEIDFAESLVRRVALLSGVPVKALERVYDERLAPSPGAEEMLAGFKAAGARILLVSGGFTFFTDRLKARFAFDESASNTLEIADGKLTGRVLPPIVDAHAKAAHLSMMRRRYASDGGIVVAIGDGANDLPMLRAADLSIAYHAKPLVRAQATFAIDHCGLGAVLNLFA